jgi:uncharacterized NAD(P)/FAD-binding protein YdhS
MKVVSITIIGLGPRGLCVLERLLSLAAQQPELQVQIVVVNKGMPGQGVHGQSLSDRFLLNTVAGLLTLIPGEAFQPSLLKGTFADFLPWLNQQGIAASAGAYVPRRLFGAYCHELYQRLLERCPLNCQVEYIDDEAIDIQQAGQKEVTCLLTQRKIVSDHVVVAVGHMLPVANSQEMIADIYTAELSSRNIPAGSTVGIQGFGLTAMDAIAELTRGRGGIFADGVYKPSGNEPNIILFSRSGLPSRARPVDDGCAAFAPTLHFNEQAALALRKQRGQAAINFMTEIYPLLALDVAQAMLDREVPTQAAMALMNGLLWPEMSQKNSQEYSAAVVEFVKQDLYEAHLGLSGSAVKRAVEVLMNARDAIRTVVNYGGLTPSSHSWFYNHFASAINRNAIGPQHERQQELLMLIDAGIVSTPLGPAPELQWAPKKHCWHVQSTVFDTPVSIDLDQLLQGYTSQPTLTKNTSGLLGALVEGGRIHARHTDWLATPGVAVNAESKAVSSYGVAQEHLFITGVMSEGSTYYNWYVPTIDGKSTPFVEAQRIASAVLGYDKEAPDEGAGE